MATSLGSRMAHCSGRHEDSRTRLKHTLARNTEAHTVLYDTEGSCRGFVFSMDKTHKSMQNTCGRVQTIKYQGELEQSRNELKAQDVTPEKMYIAALT